MTSSSPPAVRLSAVAHCDHAGACPQLPSFLGGLAAALAASVVVAVIIESRVQVEDLTWSLWLWVAAVVALLVCPCATHGLDIPRVAASPSGDDDGVISLAPPRAVPPISVK